MFCDHYIFVSPSLTSYQLETCSSYYKNAAQQPWYIGLVTAVPILVGLIVIFKNFRRSIYDMLSVPLFLTVVAVFIFRVTPNVQLISSSSQLTNKVNEGFLQQIAYNHAIMAALLLVLIILQLLAGKTKKIPTKKKA
jgi:hypothetical protein